MAMTLRTTAEDEQVIERLQARWGLSKHAAIIQALRVADEGTSLEQEALAACRDVASEYGDVLDRLGSV